MRALCASICSLKDVDMPEEHNPVAEDWFRYALALEASDEGFFDFDLIADQLWASSRFRSIAGLCDCCSTLRAWLDRIHPHDRPSIENELLALRHGHLSDFAIEHRVQNQSGSWRWAHLRAVAHRDPSGRIAHIAGSLRDNTAERMADPLTGLPNRAFFVDHLERRIERGFQHADWNFALLSITIDRFDSLCETLGSGGGEHLLIETATRLQDLLPESSLAARLLGAEFMILLEGAHSQADAAGFAASLLASFREPVVLTRQARVQTLAPQLAIGIAHAGMQYSHPEELMVDAESALLHARRQEPPRIACYSPGMREHAQELVIDRLELEEELRRAIGQGELVLHYQPEVDLRTNRIIGFEALVRWNHTRRGLLSPAEFIPLAEETGLIVPLGQWGLAEACRQLVEWRRTGSEPLQKARISVNLSAKQLEQSELIGQVEHILAQSGLPPACLRLEVTESSFISDTPAPQRNMLALEKLGVGLHMDDFGTGYSSLDYLQRFPFDTLKIDRSFVRGIAWDHDSRLIVGSILALARSFGMDVVAEGIEDADQLEELKTMGCPCGQGFYFARPMDPSAIDALIRTGAWAGAAGFSPEAIAQA
jgi:diguanylate cyclase (GGDEF)-like protein/PAS domain S-box-containing protein